MAAAPGGYFCAALQSPSWGSGGKEDVGMSLHLITCSCLGLQQKASCAHAIKQLSGTGFSGEGLLLSYAVAEQEGEVPGVAVSKCSPNSILSCVILAPPQENTVDP